ncbi:type VI secretion system tip protein VgrG [Paraburkholderia sp. IMGN_8]|uniref:type VI secretion system tip protein VgrG n=1 Tax=Paraburkholderia sp. IMGN_8 TaxID=3136564 RepID=UPI003101A51B
MNAVTKSFTDALRHPSARLTQHLKIWIGTLDLGLDVLKFKVRAGFCKDYTVDITVTSQRLDIDGKQCVGRRAGLQIDERAAVPSASYVEPVDHEAATFNGVVTRWKRIRVSRDEAAYRLRIEPRFAALCKRMVRSDTFKDVTFQELVTKVLIDRQNFDAFDVEFQLEGEQEKMEQVVMYEESVWNLVTRHAKRKGYFWFYKQGRGRKGQLDTLVIADNPRAYIRSINVPLLANSGLNSNWHEAVLEVSEQRELVAATLELWERNYRTPEDPLRATASVSDDADDRSVFGQISRSAEFHLTQEQGEALAQTRRDEQIARQATLSGTTNAKGVAPGVVMKLTNTKLASAEYGFVITSMKMEGSRTQPAHTRFKAMPAHLTYRPRFVYERDWRFLEGPVVGVVTTFDSAPYGCMDEYGRYPVLPKFLQGSGNTDKQLLKLRLLRPSSSYQGGFHSPLLPGTEVILDAAHHDVDRIHIAGALHDYSHPDVVHGAQAMFSYAIWRSPLRGAEIVFNDLQGKESARIATVYSQSAVNLGYLLNGKKLQRGEGFEITAQAWGTMRAAKGLFFSADAAAGADTPHLDMPAAVAQLKAALQRVTDLATATTQTGADPADRATQVALLHGLNQLRDAGLLASAPGGMAFVTPKSAQHSAGENVIVTAGKDMDVSITKRLRMAAGELISLCAHKLGLSLTAAKGKVSVAALTDGMDLFAKQQLRVASEGADVQVAAKSKITLNSGGASLVIENGNMTFHCPGAFTIKAASFSFQGPDKAPTPLPSLPKSSLKISDQYSSSH